MKHTRHITCNPIVGFMVQQLHAVLFAHVYEIDLSVDQSYVIHDAEDMLYFVLRC